MDAPADVNRATAAAKRRRSGEPPRRAAATAERLTMADIVGLLRVKPGPAGRAAIAAKFGRQFDELAVGENRDLAAVVLRLLARDVEREVRRSLAEAIAGSIHLPPGVAARLARDDIEVARPILERSPVLRDGELAAIVRTHAIQYALAVAGRETLSEALCDALAETGDRQVIGRLLGNAGAKLSARTMIRIIDDYRDDREIQDRLVHRPALPREVVERLAGVVAERLEWELVREARLEPELARRIADAARRRATTRIVARGHGGAPDALGELRRRHRAGELGPEEVLRLLRAGDIPGFEAGMALLAGLDAARTRRLLYGHDRRCLAAACARAGFPAPLYVVVRMALELAEESLRPGGGGSPPAYAAETRWFIQEQYERVRADADLVARLVGA